MRFHHLRSSSQPSLIQSLGNLSSISNRIYRLSISLASIKKLHYLRLCSLVIVLLCATHRIRIKSTILFPSCLSVVQRSDQPSALSEIVLGQIFLDISLCLAIKSNALHSFWSPTSPSIPHSSWGRFGFIGMAPPMTHHKLGFRRRRLLLCARSFATFTFIPAHHPMFINGNGIINPHNDVYIHNLGITYYLYHHCACSIIGRVQSHDDQIITICSPWVLLLSLGPSGIHSGTLLVKSDSGEYPSSKGSSH